MPMEAEGADGSGGALVEAEGRRWKQRGAGGGGGRRWKQRVADGSGRGADRSARTPVEAEGC